MMSRSASNRYFSCLRSCSFLYNSFSFCLLLISLFTQFTHTSFSFLDGLSSAWLVCGFLFRPSAFVEGRNGSACVTTGCGRYSTASVVFTLLFRASCLNYLFRLARLFPLATEIELLARFLLSPIAGLCTAEGLTLCWIGSLSCANYLSLLAILFIEAQNNKLLSMLMNVLLGALGGAG